MYVCVREREREREREEKERVVCVKSETKGYRFSQP